MAWKFSSDAARERHANLISRIEPTRREPASAPKVPPAVRVNAAPSASPARSGRDGRVEPTIVVPPPEASWTAEPQAEPVLEAFGKSEVAPATEEKAEPALEVVPETIPKTVVMDDALPEEGLTWAVPEFTGDPDELPDLRPSPPPPKEHPGMQYRYGNTFGHALRMPADDERQQLWAEQRRDRGFDDTELWGLDDTFARFILPRLKALRQQKLEPPNKTMELTLWYSLLDKMIRAFELLLPEGGGAWSRGTLSDRERAQLQDGLDLFRKYFFALSL